MVGSDCSVGSAVFDNVFADIDPSLTLGVPEPFADADVSDVGLPSDDELESELVPEPFESVLPDPDPGFDPGSGVGVGVGLGLEL
jgi:hypothetical protein